MKRLITMFLIIGVAMFFYSCSENNSTAPELSQSNQVINILAKEKIQFEGICTFVAPGVGGDTTFLPNGKILVKGYTTVWHDATNDPRVTGNTYWYVNQKIEEDGTFKYWGKAVLIVDGGLGKWEMSWHGDLTYTAEGPMLVANAVGQGKEGDVKGLVAEWTYTMDFALSQYNIVGHIKE
ncbi:MAG: hypothetical protein ABFS12_04405 [Bacteroidota bacterium]